MYEDKDFAEIYQLLLEDGFNNYSERTGYRLGLDFGTSYTKASFYLHGDSGNICFNYGKRFKPSVVYLDINEMTLSLFKTSRSAKAIHYFKATMVENENYAFLKDAKALGYIDDKKLKENFEFLCSVFFIANIINYSSLYISKIYKQKAMPTVSMGIPMSWNNKNAVIYNRALFIAWRILGKSFGKDITTMSLKNIYDIYQKELSNFDNDSFNPKKELSRNMTIPEVVTEMNHFLNKKNIPIGCYCIVDIGGGTADFAFITKENGVLIKDANFFCRYSLVRELGDQVRKVYREKGKEQQYQAAFSSAFNECCQGAKKNMQEHGMVISAMFVKVYLLGGGAQVEGEYYKAILTSKDNTKLLDSMNVSIEVILPQDEDEARHIIANQLSLSDKGLKLLAGIPLY